VVDLDIDAGFGTTVLADMMATLDRFTDGEIPVNDPRTRTTPTRRVSRAAFQAPAAC
jgi:hypothetical protein